VAFDFNNAIDAVRAVSSAGDNLVYFPVGFGDNDARANSVRRFLIAQGVPAGRLSTVTYGKERPVALCSDESCWSQNRRGVSVVSRGAGS